MSCRLECVVQHYEWGDRSAIPALLGKRPDGRPHAELWMGAHRSGPSRVDGQGLDGLIARDPVRYLGADIAARFGELPFLFKVLAADQPLSLQVHPSAAQAAAGFDREDAAGVPLDAPERTYRDRHHKPEILCALTEFEAKCGFRTATETLAVLDALECPDLDPVRRLLVGADEGGQGSGEGSGTVEAERVRAAFEWLMRLDADRVDTLVTAVDRALVGIDPLSPHARALRSCSEVASQYPGDVGVVVGLLLHHVVLQPGQAMFVSPGLLHGYVRGVGIELMSNSDNVVRCGLTAKHVDVAEALAIVDVRPATPPLQTADQAVCTFDTPVEEFSLTRVELAGRSGGASRSGAPARPSHALSVEGPAIVLLTGGAADLEGHGRLVAGEAVLVPAVDGPCRLTPLASADDDDGLAWVARPGP